MNAAPTLRRTLGTFALSLYGIGVIVGAGIFVLVGEVVALAGPAGWLAFVGASIAALPTGLAYAELASRYPRSGGEAVYAARAFGRPGISFLVGFLVVVSGVTSTAAVSHGFVDYLRVLVSIPWLPRWGVIVAFLALLSVVNDRGIRGATWLTIICTIASVVALAVVGVAGIPRWEAAWPSLLDASLAVPSSSLVGAVALAFYAFIGFEDVCNMAEETRSPSRTVPRAILIALLVASALYALVTITALAVLPVDTLASHGAPVALVAERVLPGVPPDWLAVVALLAVTNTALLNLMMASRVLYGMARSGWLPAALGTIGERTQTPHLAVWSAFGLAVALALTGVLAVLAEATNVVILLAFASVNASLLMVRWRSVPSDEDADAPFRVPLVVPVLGIAVTLLLLTQLSAGAYLRAGVLVVVGLGIHLAVRVQSKTRKDE